MSGQDFLGVKFKIIFLVLLAAFLAPYSIGWNWGWWKFMPSTLVILGCARLAWPGSWPAELGLRARRDDLGFAVLMFTVVYVVGAWLIGGILGQQGFVPGPVSENPGWKYLAVFQALNEEMVLRALLLTWLSRHVSKRIALCVLVAVVFALAHGVYVEGSASVLGLGLILVFVTWGWSRSRRKLVG